MAKKTQSTIAGIPVKTIEKLLDTIPPEVITGLMVAAAIIAGVAYLYKTIGH